MKKALTFSFFLLFLGITTHAQKAAIVGVNEGTPDGFSFVVLEDILANSNTKIYFTTEEYDAGNGRFCSNGSSPCAIQEDLAYWEVGGSNIPKGAVISIVETSDDNFRRAYGPPPWEYFREFFVLTI